MVSILILMAIPRPLIIAHRGASDYLLEHTLEGYAAGYVLGADFIEPDVVSTADGVLICNHDIELDHTTNAREVYPDRARPDGHWYVIDFTLDEIRRLRRVDRGGDANASLPPGGSTIPTFEEMIALVQRLNERIGRSVGVIPELKKPTFHREAGMPTERLIVDVLARWGYTSRGDPAIIQCFEIDTLRLLRGELGVELRLMALSDALAISPAELDAIAQVAHCLGASRLAIEDSDGSPTGGKAMVDAAHELGLAVMPYTFTSEPEALRRFFHEYGVDGLFANDPAAAHAAR